MASRFNHYLWSPLSPFTEPIEIYDQTLLCSQMKVRVLLTQTADNECVDLPTLSDERPSLRKQADPTQAN